MKLATQQIATFLKDPRKVCGALLVYGPDEGLVSERARQIAQTVVKDPKDPFCAVEISPTKLLEDPPLLRDELSAISFTGDKRLVSLYQASDKLSKIIEEAYEGGPFDAFLLITAGDLPARSSLRALAEKQEGFAALPCYHDDARNLEAVIRGVIEQAGLRCNRDVVQYLAAHLGNDRGVTLRELEKLVLYKIGDEELTLEDAVEVVGANDELKVDDLCCHVGMSNAAGADEAYQRLLREGEHPVTVLRALQRHFQRLRQLKASVDEGMSADSAIAALRPPLFFKQVPIVKQQLGKWSSRKLDEALARLLNAERILKSGHYPQDLVGSGCVHEIIRIAA